MNGLEPDRELPTRRSQLLRSTMGYAVDKSGCAANEGMRENWKLVQAREVW
jgi:hypothetical protein